MTSSSPRKRRTVLITAFAALPVTIACGIAFGIIPVPLSASFGLLLEAVGIGTADDASSIDRIIIEVLRTPRVLLLALAGAALATSGATLQATFHNPMASPGIIGVTAGGALGAVLAIASGLGETALFAVPVCAFAGALTASLLVYFLAYIGGRPSTTSLLLTGVAVGALATAITSWVQTWTGFHRLREIVFWMVGGAQDRTWEHVGIAAPPILAGVSVLLFLHRRVDALALGEEHALSVGVPVHRTRLLLLVLCSVVAGTAVSFCGPIPFVGLMVPHMGRLAVGAGSRYLLPLSAVFGAEFLVACDLGARVASGERTVHLGVITAVLGVPFFLWLLTRTKVSA